MFKKYFSLNNLSTLLLYFSILAFTVAFNFSDNRSGGWYQQFLPDIASRQISDIEFLDSLTGLAVANQPSDTSYILKTTDGGDNWQIIYRKFYAMNRLQFLNLNTGYACGGYLYKTTDEGNNWSRLNTPSVSTENMYVLNEDTIWFVNSDGLVGGVYRTTNGGTSWTRQLNLGTLNPENIYMYNKDIGFILKVNTGAPYTRKTTDGGQSWFVVVNNEGFTDMYFIDTLTGWRAYRTMKKSTDGGLNWVNQILPQGGYINLSQVLKFSNINADTIWGVNGYVIFPNNQLRGIVYRTTNSGNNWFYQVPDTAMHASNYYFTKFITGNIGWAYTQLTGIHTKVGGDTTFYTSIQQLVSVIPEDFELKQNYPNPFNPRTVIRFSLKKNAKVRLIVYDIRGIEVQRLADGRYDAGEYEADFMGKFSSSGVYFYRLEVSLSDPMEAEDERSGKIFSDTKRMILIK